MGNPARHTSVSTGVVPRLPEFLDSSSVTVKAPWNNLSRSTFHRGGTFPLVDKNGAQLRQQLEGERAPFVVLRGIGLQPDDARVKIDLPLL
jgi:hypothetical protein